MENIKHIKEYTIYTEAKYLTKVYLSDTNQIAVRFTDDRGLKWHGEIQKIYLDKNGEATGYDVYIY